MKLVVFLRGVNVGGARRFRPSLLPEQLPAFGLVNLGAAGTLVARRAPSATALRAALTQVLPFETEIMICSGRTLQGAMAVAPFENESASPTVVRFVSVLARPARETAALAQLPRSGRWLVRILHVRGRFVFGEYRREMQAIGYLGRLDAAFGCVATTRGWGTMLAVEKALGAGSG